MGTAIALCGALLGVTARAPGRWVTPASILAEPGEDGASGQSSPGRLGAAVLATAAYLAAFEPLGYLLATPPYVTTIVLIQRPPRPWSVLAPAVLLTASFYVAFRFGLLIPVPDGLLETWVSW
jgi:hypothetical protein